MRFSWISAGLRPVGPFFVIFQFLVRFKYPPRRHIQTVFRGRVTPSAWGPKTWPLCIFCSPSAPVFPLHPFQCVALLCGPRFSCLAFRTEGKLFANCLFFFLRRNHFRQHKGNLQAIFCGTHFFRPFSGSLRLAALCQALRIASHPSVWSRPRS